MGIGINGVQHKGATASARSIYGDTIYYTQGEKRKAEIINHTHTTYSLRTFDTFKNNNSAARYRFLVWVAGHQHTGFEGFFPYSIDVI